MACSDMSCVFFSQGECTMTEVSYRHLCPYFDWDREDIESEED